MDVAQGAIYLYVLKRIEIKGDMLLVNATVYEIWD